MANTLRFKRGLVATIPTALAGEPLFTTDTFDLYIGNGTGNTRFQKYIASGATTQILRGDGSLYTFPLNISSPSNGQVLKYDGTNWVNSADAGVTGSGTAGQVTYWGSSSTITGSNSLFWDNTNGRLGIGTITPSTILNIFGSTPILAISTSNNSVLHGIEFRAGTTFDASIKQLPASGELQFNVGRNSSWGGLMTFVTDTTEKMRLTSTGNLLLGSTTNNGLRFQVTGDGFFSGSVGIGTSSLTGYNLRISSNITGLTSPIAVFVDGQIQASATGATQVFRSSPTLIASAAISEVRHFSALQGTIGAGATIGTQTGFFVHSSLTGATTNYGFYGDIASGTGRWNLYMNGTAANYLAGNLGIGSAITTFKLSTFNAGSYTIGLLNSSIGTPGEFVGITYGFGASTYNKGAMYFISRDANGRGDFHFALNNAASAANVSTSDARMILTYEGNLGLGVTPSAWGTANFTRALQLNAGSIWTFGTSSFFSGQNYFFNGSNRIYYTTAAATEYAQISGSHIWYNAPSGTAGNAITFTQAMTLFATGNLAVGTTTDAGFRLDVNGTMRVSGAATFGSNLNLPNTGEYYLQNAASTTFIGLNFDTPYIRFAVGGTVRMIINNGGNIGVGVTPSAWSGRAMQIGARASIASVTDDLMLTNNAFYDGTNWKYIQSTLASNYYQSAGVHVWRTAVSGTAGNNITWTEQMRVFANGNLLVGTSGTDAGFKLDVSGTMRVTGASTFGGLVTISGSATTLLQITSTGAASYIGMGDSSGSLTYIGSDDGTFLVQTPGSSYSTKFSINSAGASTFSGTVTISGGNGYQVINSASTTVTALRPTGGGTSIMSTNSNGLHIAVGTEAAGDLILASNNTERIRLSSNGFFSQINATNPSSSITDSYIQYSADVTAGNAAPHFRTENGAVIKLYQETTAVGNAIFSQGGGNAVLDDSTFAGYTIRQVVQALRNQGILQ